jgi:hypothetical protein
MENGHVLKAGRLVFNCTVNTPPNIISFEDLFIDVTGNTTPVLDLIGFSYSGNASLPANAATSYIRAQNCIFRGPNHAASFTSNQNPSGKNTVTQVTGCKLISNKYNLVIGHGGSNPDHIRFSAFIENNAFYVVGSDAAAFANGRAIGLWAGSSFFQMAVQHIVNNTFYLANPTAQAAFAGTGSNGVGNAAVVNFANNAVNGVCLDVATFPSAFFRTNMAVPADLQSITSTDFGFLNTNSVSDLFTAGAAPTIPFNPYVSSPNLIGVYFAAPVVGLPGSSMHTGIPAVSGVGFLSPYKSRLLPNASASISHARILNTYRDGEAARNFHELIRSTL